MKQSQLFGKTLKEAPKDELSANAKLLERGGFIYKNSAGIYTFLPLGFRVMNKIKTIIQEEMNAVGGQEMFMQALVEKKYMEPTDRWNLDVGFFAKGLNDKDANFVLGWSHEEILTAIASKYVNSYKDLPFAAYQIQTKFRNEARAKSGLLRGREFMMKDLYSFHVSEEDLTKYYARVADAYRKIFKRLDLEAIYTLAAGGAFTISNTHEFQVVSDVGEDTILVCRNCGYAENKEISGLGDGQKCLRCDGGKVEEKKVIEVGNIFPLGTKYSEAFDLKFADKDGAKKYVVMGSYGIGLGRVMAAAVEVHHDNAGIIWPDEIAPFRVHLLELEGASGGEFYSSLQKAKISVLYDTRDMSAGEKFAEADLIGIPWRAVVSKKTGGKVELKARAQKETKLMSADELVNFLLSVP